MRFAQSAAVLFAFWLVLTGSLAPLDLALGAAFAALLALWSVRFLWGEDAPVFSARQAWRLALYLPHLLVSVVLSAIQVAEVVLDPRMPIEPVLTRHRAPFRRPVSRVVFANSITMTPGTLTVDVDENTFLVHCLAERFATDIASGELEHRVTHVFEE